MSTYTRTHRKYYYNHDKEISERLKGSIPRKEANRRYYLKNKEKLSKLARLRLKARKLQKIRDFLYNGIQDSFKSPSKIPRKA